MIGIPKGFSKVKAENRRKLRAAQNKIRELPQYRVSSNREYLPTSPSLPDWAWRDLYSSFPSWLIEAGTTDQLIFANIQYLEDVEARGEFGLSVHSKGDQAKAIASGIWFTYGTTIDGKQGETIYAKPQKPRLTFKNGKLEPVKYETPSGSQATPILLAVPNDIAQAILKRYNVTPLEGETFWRTVQRSNIPIVITEGVKKALCLIAHGISAIALRGVDCGFRKGTTDLHDSLKDFATEGREIYICFDQDIKPKTVRNVSCALTKLAKEFELAGCVAEVPVWEPRLGKGIDDVLAVQSTNSQIWFDLLLKTAPNFKIWRKSIRKARLLSALAWLNYLTINPERLTTGERLPELPNLEKGAIHVVTAPMGTGKTHQIGKWVKAGYFVLVLSPLNSLGKQTAQRWGLPHRHDFGTDRDQQTAFRLLVQEANGVVLCIDSLERAQEFITADTRLLIVIDEANQVLEGLNSGGTLKDRQGKILELFASCLQIAARNGAIVLSEATIYPRTLNQIKTLSEIEQVRLFAHASTAQSWQCEVYTDKLSGFVAELIEAVTVFNKKVLLTTSSRNQGKKIERLIQKFYPNKTTLRIDSETNQCKELSDFFYDPNKYLKGLPEPPDILILSPSAKSGVSIEIEGFDEAWGIFTCLNPSVWIQQLGRYRLPVPRKIFTEKFILASVYDQTVCSKQGVLRNLQANLNEYSKIFNLAEVLEQDEQDTRWAQIQASQHEFYSESQTAIGIEKQFPVEVLTLYLETDGHTVDQRTILGNADWHNELKDIQEELWREEATAIASAQPDFDLKKAQELLQQPDLSTELRLKAQKVIWREEFPGVAFNDPKECYEVLTKNFGRLRRGVLLQSRAANLDKYKKDEAADVEAILRGRVKLPHTLPKKFLQAALIHELGILELLDGSPYSEQDNRILTIKQKALYYANDISKWFNLFIKPEQTGIQITNKLLKKLGLKAEQLCKQGKRGEQVRIWGISDLCNPIRVKLLKAAYRKLEGDQTLILTAYPETYCKLVKEAERSKAEKVKTSQRNPVESKTEDDKLEQHLKHSSEDELELEDGGWSWEVDNDRFR